MVQRLAQGHRKKQLLILHQNNPNPLWNISKSGITKYACRSIFTLKQILKTTSSEGHWFRSTVVHGNVIPTGENVLPPLLPPPQGALSKAVNP